MAVFEPKVEALTASTTATKAMTSALDTETADLLSVSLAMVMAAKTWEAHLCLKAWVSCCC